jgi:hypothetical protein
LVEALRALGVESYGLDGASSAPEYWPADKRHYYFRADLNGEVILPRTDLVTCLEVAEHLPPSQGERLINLLTSQSPNWICFTSAPPGASRDPSHRNEKPYSYWYQCFHKNKYHFDATLSAMMRVSLRRTGRVPFWYIRNFMMFGRPGELLPLDQHAIQTEIEFLELDRQQLECVRLVGTTSPLNHVDDARQLFQPFVAPLL